MFSLVWDGRVRLLAGICGMTRLVASWEQSTPAGNIVDLYRSIASIFLIEALVDGVDQLGGDTLLWWPVCQLVIDANATEMNGQSANF